LSLEARSAIRHALTVLLLYSALFIAFFSPVLFGNTLLASGDSLLYYLPNFYAPKFFWDPLTFSGFPLFADPQVLSWYPPAVLFLYIASLRRFHYRTRLARTSWTLAILPLFAANHRSRHRLRRRPMVADIRIKRLECARANEFRRIRFVLATSQANPDTALSIL